MPVHTHTMTWKLLSDFHSNTAEAGIWIISNQPHYLISKGLINMNGLFNQHLHAIYCCGDCN